MDSRALYNTFLTYTGLDTGYGFFSPNVASGFVIVHTLYTNTKTQTIFSNSMFQTSEGAMRFTNINSLFMDKLDSMEKRSKKPDSIKENTLGEKYLSMILERMSNHLLKKNKKLDSVRTTIFLHHFPFLKEYPNTQPKFIKIESITEHS